MGYSFIHRGGHIEVVDAMGRFVLSADTIAEAHKELARAGSVKKNRIKKPPHLGRRKENIYGRDFRKNV